MRQLVPAAQSLSESHLLPEGTRQTLFEDPLLVLHTRLLEQSPLLEHEEPMSPLLLLATTAIIMMIMMIMMITTTIPQSHLESVPSYIYDRA